MRLSTMRPLSLQQVYRRLRARYGHAGWWRGETPLEVCLGAILTQNTAWRGAARAIEELRRRRLLSYAALRPLPPSRIAPLIRSSGVFRVKARRIAAFLRFLGDAYGGRVESMRREDPWVLRARLLTVHGIGPETADAMVLYAAGLPLFVVDAYTRRIFSRLGLVDPHAPYDEIQRFFMDRLPRKSTLLNDYHAQIVRLGKEACRSRPRCADCPLDDVCPKRGVPPHASRPEPRAKIEALGASRFRRER
jgi:endonuclease III related protein